MNKKKKKNKNKKPYFKTEFSVLVEKEAHKRQNKLLVKNSPAESHFAELLNKASIFYVREKLNYDYISNWCYTDFYLPYYHLAIEIDGKEHSYGKRLRKDIKKANFLESKRKIKTIRYTNEECLAMNSISLVDIMKKADMVITPDSKEYRYINKLMSAELKDMSRRVKFDVYAKFYLYDKQKDAKFVFNNLFIMKHSTGTGYKYLVNAIVNGKNINVSNLYIITDTEEELDKRIEEYYEYLWNPKGDMEDEMPIIL